MNKMDFNLNQVVERGIRSGMSNADIWAEIEKSLRVRDRPIQRGLRHIVYEICEEMRNVRTNKG